jgi:hypothetical protein
MKLLPLMENHDKILKLLEKNYLGTQCTSGHWLYTIETIRFYNNKYCLVLNDGKYLEGYPTAPHISTILNEIRTIFGISIMPDFNISKKGL